MNDIRKWKDILLPGMQHLRGRACGDLKIVDGKLFVVVCRWWEKDSNRSYIPWVSIRVVTENAMVIGSGAKVFVEILNEMLEEIRA